MPNITELYEKLIDKCSGWLETLVVMLPNLLAAVLIVVVAVRVSRLVGRLFHRVVERLTGNDPIGTLLGTVARTGTIALGLFFALGLLDMDKTVTSLLAGVGIVGLALGFAFQDIAANFMSGFIMAINRPFNVGDLVEVSGHIGHVRQISMRASVIETLQGLSVLIPNKDVFQNAIINYTDTPRRRLDVSVGTAYGDDMEKVRRVVCAAVQEVPGRDPKREVELFFDEFGESSINFSVRIWLSVADERSYRLARSEAMIAIKKALDAERLTIPFPIRTLDFGAAVVGGRPLDDLKLRVERPS